MNVKFAIEFETDTNLSEVDINNIKELEREIENIICNITKSIEKDYNVKYTGNYQYISEKTNSVREYDNGVFYSYEN